MLRQARRSQFGSSTIGNKPTYRQHVALAPILHYSPKKTRRTFAAGLQTAAGSLCKEESSGSDDWVGIYIVDMRELIGFPRRSRHSPT
jgi:putative methionine-R-sulfoxide reductase with GAF domain